MTEQDPVELFSRDLVADVVATAEADSLSTPEAFTRRVLEDLERAGEVENTFVAHYAARGVEVSGYGSNDTHDCLDLYLTYFRQVPERITRTQVERLLRRLRSYVDRAVAGLAQKLDDSTDVHDMTTAVAKHLTQSGRLRLFLLTNAVAPTTTPQPEDHDGLSVSFHVWDVARLYRLDTSGTQSEPIVVDFDPPLACLGPSATASNFSVLLSVLPGHVLADLYARHGTRLLELNVRSFLQGRGSVNRGMRQTLITEPERFLAYNNGITATASHVEFTEDPVVGPGGPDGPTAPDAAHEVIRRIRRVHDLQIVNGGQTTASLHHARFRDRVDVSHVQVQMKLTVVPADQLREIVPEISRYSNTQNKVTVVDFSSNHPFHVAVEKVTRRLWAPAADGGSQETRWFYERARGQYNDAIGRERTPAAVRRFRLINPTAQKFTKADLAKFLNSWDGQPHLVSRGAEKNFNAFMTAMGDDSPPVDRQLCERLIATAILFRRTDRIVAQHDFGGYKINNVTYTIARLANATAQRVDLDQIWRLQGLTTALADNLRDLSGRIQQVIVQPQRGTNVGEWAKHPDCWSAVLDLSWQPSDDLLRELTATSAQVVSATTNAEGDARPADPAPGAVAALGSLVWSALSIWAQGTHNLQPWQRQLATTVARTIASGGEVSAHQARQALDALGEAEQLGFTPTPRLVTRDSDDQPAGAESYGS